MAGTGTLRHHGRVAHVATIATLVVVPEDEDPGDRVRVDVLGAVLLALTRAAPCPGS